MTVKEAKPQPRADQSIPAVMVRQPRAAAALAGPGPFKHQGWWTDYRGPLLIHAARRESGDPPAGQADSPPYSVLLGLVDLVDCVCTERADGGPDEDGFIWVLANPRRFAAPIPYVGRPGMFQVAAAVVAVALAGRMPAPGARGATPKASRPKKGG